MKAAYESKVETLERSLKKVQAESKFTNSVLSKTKDNLKKKFEEQQQRIIALEAN
jgi:hypothetical protein